MPAITPSRPKYSELITPPELWDEIEWAAAKKVWNVSPPSEITTGPEEQDQ